MSKQIKLTNFLKRKNRDWETETASRASTSTTEENSPASNSEAPGSSSENFEPVFLETTISQSVLQEEEKNQTIHLNDIGNYVNKDVQNKIENIQLLWFPPASYKFPILEKFRQRGLKFQHKWLSEYDWLCYSEKEKGAFCKFCVFFAKTGGIGSQDLGALCKLKFDNWKKAREIFNSHQLCKYHIRSIMDYENLKNITENKQQPIINLLDTDRQRKAIENRKKLIPIIEAIVLCGRQEIALRGHRDSGAIKDIYSDEKNEGNFRALLKYRAKGDTNLRDFLENAPIRETYISPKIQNQIIDCINSVMLNQLTERINRAGAFSILADETTDISTIEQITLCVRYVNEFTIYEDFLQFVPAEGLSGEALSNSILNGLKNCGVDLSNLVGQGYDGASNMSGKFIGTQAQIRKSYPKAIYVHCAAHCLNLAVTKASSIQPIRNCLSVIERVYDFLNTPKRKNVLLKTIEKSEIDPSVKTLKRLCATRWVARFEALNDFAELYSFVFKTLDEISEWRDSGDAPLLRNSLIDSEFIISLNVAKQIFGYGMPLSRILQTINLDLKEAVQITENTISVLTQIRNNAEDEFNTIFEQSEKMADQVGIEIKTKRICKRQINRDNPTCISETPVIEYFRTTVYIPYIDFFLSQLKERFTTHKDIFEGFMCLFSNFGVDAEKKNQSFNELLDLFLPEIPKNVVIAELKLWQTNNSNLLNNSKTMNKALDSLKCCSKIAFPNIFKLLTILCTLPVSTATPERTFSTLKRIKTYLRNSTSQSRLNGLALLSIHREIPIKIEEIFECLMKVPRRLDFVL